MQNYKLIIFDWDGTLMDSIDRIVSSMQSVALLIESPVPSQQQIKNIIGLSLPEALGLLFPSISESTIEQAKQLYKKQYSEIDTTPTPLFKHAMPLLDKLRSQNKVLAIATGKGRSGLERVMHESDTKHFFSASRCAQENLSKPDPQMLNSLLAELNFTAKDAVMIGDTRHDLEMARRAGIDAIGVTMGVDTKDTLNEYQPIAVVDSLLELDILFS
jgi:phosphoglycolate phosphatase